jgi:DNA gyrase inhibitor GyrI
MSTWDDTIKLVVTEPDTKVAIMTMTGVEQYECLEAMEQFYRIVGMPPLISEAPGIYQRDFEAWRRRFNRSVA